MKKNIIIVILLCIIAFGGCYMYTDKHMSKDEIHNDIKYIPFKEKESIKTDNSKKHNTDKKKTERNDTNNSSKDIPESVKKKSKAKETITTEAYKCKYCNDTIYYIIEDKEYGFNGNICWACYWNKLMDIIFGPIEDDNDNEDVDEPDNDDDKTNKCSICGKYVGGKEMCECDGTIHHRTCHTDAYTCPGCGRYGLTEDPDVYGCPYCGYPDEEEDEEPEEEEYTDEDEEPVEEYEDDEYTEEVEEPEE